MESLAQAHLENAQLKLVEANYHCKFGELDLNMEEADVMEDVMKFADVQTFTNPLGKLGQKFQALVQETPLARYVVPFIRTPTNIIKFTFGRTPLAYLSSKVRADIAAGGARAAQAHARVAMGTMSMMALSDIALEGGITGAGPADPKIKSAMMRQGWRPYSMKIGDKYYQYSRLDPIGMFMGLAADMTEINQYSETERGDELLTAGVLALMNNLASKTYMSGIYDAIAALNSNDPTSDPAKYVLDQAGSLMPYSSLIRGIATTSDTIVRDHRTSKHDELVTEDFADLPEGVGEYLAEMTNSIRKQIPGLSEELPERRDLWGRPLDRASGYGMAFDFLSPVPVSKDKANGVDREIVENQIRVSMPARQISGVPLTGEEYSRYIVLAGEPAKEALDQLVKTPAFKMMSGGPDGMKATIITRKISDFRSIAQKQMMMEFPQLRERIINKKMEKAGALAQ